MTRKLLLSLFTLLLIVSTGYAQSDKLNSTTAGKFAKDLGRRMYNTETTYGDYQRGYNLNIIDWKSIAGPSEKDWYLIKVEISWQESTGGIGASWHDVYYKGCIMVDKFGCTPLFFIDERKEPSVLGILKRAKRLSDDQKPGVHAMDTWLSKAEYAWGPDDCLEE